MWHVFITKKIITTIRLKKAFFYLKGSVYQVITNKPKKGQILVYDENFNQESIDPEKLLIQNKELGQIIKGLENDNKEKEDMIIDLMKKNKMIFEILLMLIQQANINLTQQQLLTLKNNKGGNENV